MVSSIVSNCKYNLQIARTSSRYVVRSQDEQVEWHTHRAAIELFEGTTAQEQERVDCIAATAMNRTEQAVNKP